MTEQREVRSRWKDYFRGLLEVDGRSETNSMVDEIPEEEKRRK